MRKMICMTVMVSQLAGCAVPSTPYLLGQGFYSPKYAKTQVNALAVQDKLTNLGKFETTAGGCGNTSQKATDESLVIPAIQKQLDSKGADIADNVTASERWLLDFMLGLLVIPGFIGCSNWNISGDLLKVNR